MSESISAEGTSESITDPPRKPKPQPFTKDIPQPRPSGGVPRAASIYDESEPVVRSEAPAKSTPKPTPAVTGNAPERRPAENPFPKPAPEPKRVAPPTEPTAAKATPITQASEPQTPAPSNTLKAAEQLRAAASEKARQLRQGTEASKAKAAAKVPAALASPAAAPQPAPAAQATPFTQPAAAAQPAPAPVQTQPQQAASTRPVSAQETFAAAAATATAALSPDAQEKVDEWRAIAEATWADASIVLKDIQKEGERYVRENPTRAALTALGVGFVLGVFLRR